MEIASLEMEIALGAKGYKGACTLSDNFYKSLRQNSHVFGSSGSKVLYVHLPWVQSVRRIFVIIYNPVFATLEKASLLMYVSCHSESPSDTATSRLTSRTALGPRGDVS